MNFDAWFKLGSREDCWEDTRGWTLSKLRPPEDRWYQEFFLVQVFSDSVGRWALQFAISVYPAGAVDGALCYHITRWEEYDTR